MIRERVIYSQIRALDRKPEPFAEVGAIDRAKDCHRTAAIRHVAFVVVRCIGDLRQLRRRPEAMPASQAVNTGLRVIEDDLVTQVGEKAGAILAAETEDARAKRVWDRNDVRTEFDLEGPGAGGIAQLREDQIERLTWFSKNSCRPETARGSTSPARALAARESRLSAPSMMPLPKSWVQPR